MIGNKLKNMSFPRKIFLQAVLFLIGSGFVLFLTILFSAYYSLHDTTKYGLISTFLFGFFYYPLNAKLVNWLYFKTEPVVDRKIESIKNGKMGFEGENEVNSWLEEIVGKENIVRNVKLPGHKFDIDLVVVGKMGVIAFEVKKFTDARYFNNDDYFTEKEDGMRYPSPYEDPRSEAKRHANALMNYLASVGFDSVKLNRAVVFANGKASWDGKSGIYIIKDKESLRGYINELEIDPVYTLEVCKKIKSLLG